MFPIMANVGVDVIGIALLVLILSAVISHYIFCWYREQPSITKNCFFVRLALPGSSSDNAAIARFFPQGLPVSIYNYSARLSS